MLVQQLKKTGDATRIVVAFDDELSSAPASSFEITTDAGTVLTPIAAEIGTKEQLLLELVTIREKMYI